MKKNHAFSFNIELVKKAKIRAEEEGRSLTNYLEWLMKTDQNDIPR